MCEEGSTSLRRWHSSPDLQDEEQRLGNQVTFKVGQLKIAHNLLSYKVGSMGNEALPPSLKMADRVCVCLCRDWPAGVASRGRPPSIRGSAGGAREVVVCGFRCERTVAGASGHPAWVERHACRVWRAPCLPAWWTAAPGKSRWRLRSSFPGAKHLPCGPASFTWGQSCARPDSRPRSRPTTVQVPAPLPVPAFLLQARNRWRRGPWPWSGEIRGRSSPLPPFLHLPYAGWECPGFLASLEC